MERSHGVDRLKAIESLRDRVAGLTVGHEKVTTPIAALSMSRREAPTEPDACMYEPLAALIVQGRKRVLQGEEVYEYGAGQILLASVDLPAVPEVVDASPDRPYLSITLRIDQAEIVKLMADAQLPPPADGGPRRGIAVTDAAPTVLGAFARLLDLLDDPKSIPLLAPLILREIHYRLLVSALGDLLRQVAAVGSQGHQIARAVALVKAHYREKLPVEELASTVGMSPSTFHQHFRGLTGTTPLQYQKWIRLDEARRLMLAEGLDAATAGFRVGYESPSQFSREYRRRFGAPPGRHVSDILQTS